MLLDHIIGLKIKVIISYINNNNIHVILIIILGPRF